MKLVEIDYIEIGKRLREARKNANITLQELADLMNVSLSYIKNTEYGSKPSLKYLFAVVEHCHVSFDWLLTGNGNICSFENLIGQGDETEEILVKLKELLNNEDPDIRAWAKVQIKKAFAEYF